MLRRLHLCLPLSLNPYQLPHEVRPGRCRRLLPALLQVTLRSALGPQKLLGAHGQALLEAGPPSPVTIPGQPQLADSLVVLCLRL
ncbi:MAG: hypothetical protein ACT6SG_20135 [Hydrogenophaga sp.]|uniref:hypothetical protein n=1 Tax=Hydrogenophaga sp. TaxID=1904254 RepID=UPI0040369F43